MFTRTCKLALVAGAVTAVLGLAAPKAEAGHYNGCRPYARYAYGHGYGYYRPVYAPPVVYAPAVSYYRPAYVAPAYHPPVVYRSYVPAYYPTYAPAYYRSAGWNVGFGYGRHNGHSNWGLGLSFGGY